MSQMQTDFERPLTDILTDRQRLRRAGIRKFKAHLSYLAFVECEITFSCKPEQIVEMVKALEGHKKVPAEFQLGGRQVRFKNASQLPQNVMRVESLCQRRPTVKRVVTFSSKKDVEESLWKSVSSSQIG